MASLRTFVRIIAALLLVLLCLSCKPTHRDRPFGTFRLWSVQELATAPTELVHNRSSLLLRRDERGFSVMSLLCTSDLTVVSRTAEGWESENGSLYAPDGRVLRGPAQKDLPYYKLFLDRGEYGAPVLDTLYAEVGAEVAPGWRFVIPPECVNGCPVR